VGDASNIFVNGVKTTHMSVEMFIVMRMNGEIAKEPKMECSFDEKIEYPNGSYTRTVCVNQAAILITSDPCCGLCYTCAYQKLKAENAKLKKGIKIARKAMDKASMMYFRDLEGIDRMIAEHDDLIERALKGTQ
jgi:hypothetical protein